MWGQAVAAQLMIDLCGARLVPGTVDVGGEGPPPKTLRLRDEKVTRLLGTEVPLGEQAELLERLEFAVTDGGDYLDVTVPAFRRNDVTREVDLIEEVARLWGLEKLPATIPGHGMSGRLTVEQKLRRRAADALVGAGFSEAVGWSFQAPEMARKLRLTEPAVRLRNPLSEDLSEMRTTLLGSLLTAVRHNVARGREDVRLFEEGSVYFDRPHGREPTAAEARSTPLPDERMHFGALMTGRVRPAAWGDSGPAPADFFAAKGALEALMRALRVDSSTFAARTPSCTRAAPRACSWTARTPAGSARSTRASRPSGTWAASRASSSISGSCSRTPSSRRTTRTSRRSLRSGRTSRSGFRRTARRPSSSRWCAARAASCCATCACSTSTRARARRRWRCGSSSARRIAR